MKKVTFSIGKEAIEEMMFWMNIKEATCQFFPDTDFGDRLCLLLALAVTHDKTTVIVPTKSQFKELTKGKEQDNESDT